MTTIEIAKTIHSQIDKMTMMRIGAEKLTSMMKNEKRSGGLMFKASLFGRRQCQVYIELMPSDTYTVTIASIRGKVIEKTEDVYFDNLSWIINCGVEKHFRG